MKRIRFEEAGTEVIDTDSRNSVDWAILNLLLSVDTGRSERRNHILSYFDFTWLIVTLRPAATVPALLGPNHDNHEWPPP